jgi:hypothetical protein
MLTMSTRIHNFGIQQVLTLAHRQPTFCISGEDCIQMEEVNRMYHPVVRWPIIARFCELN